MKVLEEIKNCNDPLILKEIERTRKLLKQDEKEQSKFY
jgi:hypothetical protein